ncbi:potassium voltage-gated channel protein Shaw-like [Dreissena polymorpha]|uniref:potassium voltage-gated channel protein Shaw-like n=1 Tax=Dreissena polymorpha TaxID=45954 RepID=UPI002263F06B|nr:potassium voltage-gated channel protein Shaw-like [Dreissena polymorpha]
MISTISISQPRFSKSNEYSRSPNLSPRSPGGVRKSPLNVRNKADDNNTTRQNDDEFEYPAYTPGHSDSISSDTPVNATRNGGLRTCDFGTRNSFVNDNNTTYARGKMALNAAVVSGGGGGGSAGGGFGNPRKSIYQSPFMEFDAEQGIETIWTLSNSSVGQDLSRSWPGSPTPSNCTCDKFCSKETVIINVGGQTFETFKSTLRRLKSSKLADEREMMKYFRKSKGDFFFDRDPYAFNIILNYLRYGDLHLPTNLCGPALMREFQYWGIDEADIERCCFQPYNTWKTQTKSLEKLEYDRKQSTTQADLAHDLESKSCLRRMRAVVWPFLQDPSSSRAAKIYAWISIIFVCLSIFSFCAETHPMFKLPPSEVHNLRMLYKFFTLEDSKVFHENNRKSNATAISATFKGTKTLNSTFTDAAHSSNSSAESETHIQHPALLVIDLMCVFVFSIEFLTRLVFCPKKLRFCSSLQNIIDFIAIVPDYVEFILLCVSPQVRAGLSFVDFIFILRMLRLCRIFRLIRHVPGLWILLYTLKASFNELMLMFVFLLIGMVMFASLLHFIEGGEQFNNIPVGFWWAVVTMTTVGYGDMVPVTGFGYVIGSVCAISGLLMIAFTVPIIVSNFVLYYTHVQYGISDKDVSNNRMEEEKDEADVCSLHTSMTSSFEETRGRSQRKGNHIRFSPSGSIQKNDSADKSVECEKMNPVYDRDEDDPRSTRDGNNVQVH